MDLGLLADGKVLPLPPVRVSRSGETEGVEVNEVVRAMLG